MLFVTWSLVTSGTAGNYACSVLAEERKFTLSRVILDTILEGIWTLGYQSQMIKGVLSKIQHAELWDSSAHLHSYLPLSGLKSIIRSIKVSFLDKILYKAICLKILTVGDPLSKHVGWSWITHQCASHSHVFRVSIYFLVPLTK